MRTCTLGSVVALADNLRISAFIFNIKFSKSAGDAIPPAVPVVPAGGVPVGGVPAGGVPAGGVPAAVGVGIGVIAAVVAVTAVEMKLTGSNAQVYRTVVSNFMRVLHLLPFIIAICMRTVARYGGTLTL